MVVFGNYRFSFFFNDSFHNDRFVIFSTFLKRNKTKTIDFLINLKTMHRGGNLNPLFSDLTLFYLI